MLKIRYLRNVCDWRSLLDVRNTEYKVLKGINISTEMKTSFLDYAMSVIVSRAFQMLVMD